MIYDLIIRKKEKKKRRDFTTGKIKEWFKFLWLTKLINMTDIDGSGNLAILGEWGINTKIKLYYLNLKSKCSCSSTSS